MQRSTVSSMLMWSPDSPNDMYTQADFDSSLQRCVAN